MMWSSSATLLLPLFNSIKRINPRRTFELEILLNRLYIQLQTGRGMCTESVKNWFPWHTHTHTREKQKALRWTVDRPRLTSTEERQVGLLGTHSILTQVSILHVAYFTWRINKSSRKKRSEQTIRSPERPAEQTDRDKLPLEPQHVEEADF